MADEFDVFLSHARADAATAVRVAEDLRERGLRVWLDQWQILPGASIPAAIEAGLDASRVLVLLMSEAAFGSDWVTLESQTFRFRDPLNRDLRFIPLRLDAALAPGSLAQLQHIDLRAAGALDRLTMACQPRQRSARAPDAAVADLSTRTIPLGHTGGVNGVAVTPDGTRAITTSDDRTARVWDLATGLTTCTLEGHTRGVNGVAVTPDGTRAITTGSVGKSVCGSALGSRGVSAEKGMT